MNMTLFPMDRERNIRVAYLAQLVCLLIAATYEFLSMEATIFGEGVYGASRIGCGIACVAFWSVTLLLSASKQNWRNIVPGVVMVLWFLIVELQHRSRQMEPYSIFIFCSSYLIAFPFATIAGDEIRQKGIGIVAGMYIVAAFVLLADGFLLIIDRVPEFLQDYVGWSGARLQPIYHPNTAGRIFMISLIFCVGFLTWCKNKWMKAILLAATIPLFIGVVLTNSRAVVLTTCLVLGGNIFFVIHNGSVKGFFLGAVSAMLVAVSLFMLSNALFQWNSNRLLHQEMMQRVKAPVVYQPMAEPAQEPEISNEVLSNHTPAFEVQLLSSGEVIVAELSDANFDSPQGSWLNDLSTLNSRTRIWKETLEKIRNNPEIMLWGTDNSIIENQSGFVLHTHNAWLETLLRLGIPGFIMSLVFTGIAVWAALCVLWRNSCNLWQKNVAMLVLSLLVTSVLEPFLFFTDFEVHFIDFIFFLCLGYLILWKKQMPHKI